MTHSFDPAHLARLFATADKRQPASRFPLPGSIAEAMAVQAITMAGEDSASIGYKVALSPDGAPVSGRLNPLVAAADGAAVQLPWRAGLRIEAEIAVRLGADLLPRPQAYRREEIAAAVAAYYFGIEIIDSRIEEGGQGPFLLFLADRLGNGGYVLGAELDAETVAAAQTLPLTIAREGVSFYSAQARHPAGDPLAWLIAWANAPDRAEGTLRAGEIVTTGSLCGAPEVEAPGLVTVRLGEDAAEIAIRFA